MLNGLTSLKNLDMNDNNIHDSIPYQLPPNLTTLNLANKSGNISCSSAGMMSLSYLNLSHNSLSQTIGDVFTNHFDLVALDLSSNNFSRDLPPSFSSLTNLSTLHLENNQLSGTLNILVDLPLTNLHVAKNHFNGWILNDLLSIPNFMYDGNSFANGPAPPPPPYTAPPPRRSLNNYNHSPPNSRIRRGSDGQPSLKNGDKKKGLTTGAIIGIPLGSSLAILFSLVALVFCFRRGKGKVKGKGKGKGKEIATRPYTGSLPVTTDKVLCCG